MSDSPLVASIKNTLRKHHVNRLIHHRRLHDIFSTRAIPEQCVKLAQGLLRDMN